MKKMFFTFTDMPSELWEKFKICCWYRRESMTKVLQGAVERYVSDNYKAAIKEFKK